MTSQLSLLPLSLSLSLSSNTHTYIWLISPFNLFITPTLFIKVFNLPSDFIFWSTSILHICIVEPLLYLRVSKLFLFLFFVFSKVGLLNVDGYYDSLLGFFDKGVEDGFIKPYARNIVISAKNVQELMQLMEALTLLITPFFLNWLSSHWSLNLSYANLLIYQLFWMMLQDYVPPDDEVAPSSHCWIMEKAMQICSCFLCWHIPRRRLFLEEYPHNY